MSHTKAPLPRPLPRLDDHVQTQLEQLYERLDDALRAVDASCGGCGACCNFGQYDHELWLTNLELAYLVEKEGERPVEEAGICPYLNGTKCTAREGRALGCRVFHCETVETILEQLSEKYMEEITQIAKDAKIDLTYGELLASLSVETGD